jgi:hypothetical protein
MSKKDKKQAKAVAPAISAPVDSPVVPIEEAKPTIDVEAGKAYCTSFGSFKEEAEACKNEAQPCEKLEDCKAYTATLPAESKKKAKAKAPAQRGKSLTFDAFRDKTVKNVEAWMEEQAKYAALSPEEKAEYKFTAKIPTLVDVINYPLISGAHVEDIITFCRAFETTPKEQNGPGKPDTMYGNPSKVHGHLYGWMVKDRGFVAEGSVGGFLQLVGKNC